jgi:hypothetical protein
MVPFDIPNCQPAWRGSIFMLATMQQNKSFEFARSFYSNPTSSAKITPQQKELKTQQGKLKYNE